ncbi:hypothetical protein KGQ19_14980 [Catenulispora sp. NL8]|uniref:Uncharacterized protein n=1 Tax=Catenulispora pinistramenti TaxID=2705254 RepID=A0ABS5KQ91_9ACTN|nr:hypothetical protein [Catenulispora pinistramenti]MBS2548170.1 hypothetical protein [Catenulispora pinistramenti]
MDVWWVHPDFWEYRVGLNYVRAHRRAEWLADALLEVAGSEAAPEHLRLAVELYGVSLAVRVDGTAVAWIGPDPADAELWGELGPDEPMSLSLDGLGALA